VANGRTVPSVVSEAFEKLPAVMARADAQAGKIDRAVVDLAETLVLSGKEGETFGSVVTDVDERAAKVQLCDWPVAARVVAPGLVPGECVTLRLETVDTVRRSLQFSLVE
jgi:exoribonuclease R